MSKIILSDEQRKINIKAAKKKYYEKNKKKWEKWNSQNGFNKLINDSSNDELKHLIKIIEERLLIIL